MVHQTTIKLTHNSDTDSFTATLEYCEPKPGMVVTEPVIGHGAYISDALESLSWAIYLAEEEGRFA